MVACKPKRRAVPRVFARPTAKAGIEVLSAFELKMPTGEVLDLG